MSIKVDRDIKNVLILTMGTGFASAFPVLVMPILTRIYTPHDFGEFEIFSSFVILLTAIATLRLELAFVLPSDRDESLEIVSAAMTNTVIVSTIVFFVILLIRQDYFLLLPLYLLSYSFSEIGKKWLAKEGSFKEISIVRFMQASVINGLRWVIGLARPNIFSLVISAPIAQILSLVWVKDIWRFSSISKWKATLSKYKNFAYSNAPEALVLGLKELSLPIMISTLYGNFWLGQYGLTLKILKAPIFIIGMALADVYYREFSKRRNDPEFIKRIIKRYGLLILIPFALVMTILPEVMGFVFGSKWADAGLFVRCLSPIYYIAFINLVFMDKFPIIFNHQSKSMKITIVGEVISLLALYIFSQNGAAITSAFVAYCVVQGTTKLFYSFWCWKLIK